MLPPGTRPRGAPERADRRAADTQPALTPLQLGRYVPPSALRTRVKGEAVEKDVRNFGNFIEEVYGFSEAVRVGDTIYVAGQTAFGEDNSFEGEGDMATQMRRAYANIERLLGMYGASMDAVVDETLFVTDMSAALTVGGEIRKEVYGGRFELASTLCEVSGLGAPQLLVEIKCTARV